MGYAAKKAEMEQKNNKIRFVVLLVTLGVIAAVCIFSFFVPAQSWKYYVGLPKVTNANAGELRVHILDVGQGDSSLIEFPDGKTMLIDGGDEGSDEVVLRYLNALKINCLDYVMLSHVDSDHVTGLINVIKYKDVKTVIMPYLTGKETETNKAFSAFYQEVRKKKIEMKVAQRYFEVASSNPATPYSFYILHPYNVESGGNAKLEGNNLSTVAWLDYHGQSILFGGEVDKTVFSQLKKEDALVNFFKNKGIDLSSTEFLKVAHHGGSGGAEQEFYRYLNVQTAFISCGKSNAYGHPSEETLVNLQTVGADIYRTDLDGTILLTLTTDGKALVTTKN